MTALAGATDRPLVRGLRHGSFLAAVPAVILVLCSVSSDMVAMFGGDPIGIWRLLPAGPVSGDWLSAEVSSTALLLIGIAVARRKRVGFWMALTVMATALVVQGATLGHPVAAGLAILVATILVATRDRYHIGTGRRETRLAIGLVVGGVVLAGAAAVSAGNGIDAFGTAAAAVSSLLDFATPVAVPGLATLGLALVLAHIGYLVATFVALDPVPDTRPAEIVAAARRTLRRVGSGSLYPYQLAPECAPFADEAGTAALATASVGRCSVALGDPVGAPSAATGVFADWLGGCRADDRLPVVYQASEPRARTLRAQGWRSVLVGREAIIDPRAFDIGSSRVANLRHTVTRSRKGGIRTLWSSSGAVGLSEPRLVAGLVRLDAEWRRTAGPQMRFTVGHFDPRETGDTAIAVAVDEHDEPVAFAVLRPTGADDGWMLDVMRRARGGVPGAVEACLVTAIQALGEMGVPTLSLGLAPLAGLDPASDAVAERLLARGARLVRPFYDHEGLAFFKNKFAPTWEPRYLVVCSWLDLPTAAVALLRLHLGGGWARVIRSVASGLVPAR